MVIKIRLVGFFKTFSENIFSNEQKIVNNKISFSMFSVNTKNLILGKMKMWWQKNVILSKSKIFSFENTFSIFLFLESKK